MPEEKKIIRIAGTDLDGNLKIERALWKIKGIGNMFARAIRTAGGWPPDKKLGELDDNEIEKLKEMIRDPAKFGIKPWLLNRRRDIETGKDMHLVSSELEFAQKSDIEFLKKIKARRGIRHMLGLKVRGQRTRNTGRKGPAVGVSRKKVQPAKASKKE
ncbi:MAG: 30S ribosomal protein S13 [Candidatus Parvarchaeota archaeon]|nr:30S ribosomal protein S13 [Candidatus Jingweiarchaeum tengchongense]MCW1298144.1 30S ribosomal protein S13 [Candidatus Jingweiarchaeum tengchongense]MCW1299943.1 30S ribosomal protein S13 [Candidatus Jingweiarchaeum tengchongense]MCW1305072.1 30S ribosomal protein S13 [Candidatus Jingweiarchaeum tengchongense]MCW1305565.1 30S ribosomal protein S13 [Candidatus Jingweiarchaeum tengchongense]